MSYHKALLNCRLLTVALALQASLCILPLSSIAQNPDSLELLKSFPFKASYITNDQFSNTYVLTHENSLIKYDSTDKKVAVFSSNRLGRATYTDVGNPLKILVWYPDFQTVLLLDRTLGEMGRINFNKIGALATSCVGTAADGNIWAFDEANSQLKKYNLNGQLILESQPLNQLIGKKFSATRIRDNGQLVALTDPETGLCVLNQFGAFEYFEPNIKAHDIEWQGDWLVLAQKNKLSLFNKTYLIWRDLMLPPSVPSPRAYWLGKKFVFIERGDSIQLFTWQ
jgi:hypothetical protein